MSAPAKDSLLIGVDISPDACRRAARRTGELTWTCLCARGEQIPLKDESVDEVISTVAVPYFDIPTALKEIRRVLKPGAQLNATLHSLSFTVQELKTRPPVSPSAFLYRLYVFANGLWFHLTGSVLRYPFSRRFESWQSRRGISLALQQAGFSGISCTDLANGSFVVQAIRRP